MSVQFSKAAVIKKNQSAIDACSQSIVRLKTLGTTGLFPDDEIERAIQEGRATNERTHLRQVNAHLRAAGTIVRPIADDVAAELNALGNRLDDQIRDNLIIDATVDFITTVLDDASKLRAITDAHKA
jgi:hypothetical protein